MTCGIYAYQDNIYNKIIYIGASKNCEKRHKSHYAPSNMKKQYINYVLQNDIENRYSFFILLRCSEKDIFNKESAFIKMIKPEYNFKSSDDLCEHECYKTKVKETSTGFYHVGCYRNSYVYRKKINGKQYSYYNSSIRDLEYIVTKNGFLWFITDVEHAKKTLFKNDNKKTHTLYYNVRKIKANNQQGYIYKYKKDDVILTSRYIEELEYKVKAMNLEWRKF